MDVIVDSRPQEPKPPNMSAIQRKVQKYFKWRPCSVYLPVKNGVEWKRAKHDTSLLLEKEKRGSTKPVREEEDCGLINARTKSNFQGRLKGDEQQGGASKTSHGMVYDVSNLGASQRILGC
jgi:hypothetical protein